MLCGFIIMGNNVVFFQVKNVRGGEGHTLKPGDEVSFIYDDYDQGAMDVKFLPTLSDFQSTPDIPTCEVESHSRDESWDFKNGELAPSGPPSGVLDEVGDVVQPIFTHGPRIDQMFEWPWNQMVG